MTKRVPAFLRLRPTELQLLRMFALLHGRSQSDVASEALGDWFGNQEYELEKLIEGGKLSAGMLIQAKAMLELLPVVRAERDADLARVDDEQAQPAA